MDTIDTLLWFAALPVLLLGGLWLINWLDKRHKKQR